jgi:hypothetical protein
VDDGNNNLSSITLAFPIQHWNTQSYLRWQWVGHMHHMWHQAFISSELYIHSSAAISMSQLLWSSVLKMDNYTFQEYANMHLILGEAHGNGVAAVWLYAERYPQHRLLNPHTFHWKLDQEEWYCFPSYMHGGRQKIEKCTNRWCGRVQSEMRRRESPYLCLSNTSCQTCGALDSMAGSPWAVALPISFATGTSSKST